MPERPPAPRTPPPKWVDECLLPDAVISVAAVAADALIFVAVVGIALGVAGVIAAILTH